MNSTAHSLSSATNSVEELFRKYVVPSYARFDIALTRGEGAYVWDTDGKRYLDLGGGIAVTALGHAHPEIADAVAAQARKLVHTSNLYYHEGQGKLAEQMVKLIGPGKIFFCNTGAEANEGLFKLARKFGHDEGRFEIITAENSFHGRTLAAISATGQDKVKKGFEPMVQGFNKHVPFNDLEAMRKAISPATVAILIEGVQGEGGITPATTDYLVGLRKLCDEKKLLLMMDAVQCGNFRTGRYQSFQRILENTPAAHSFLPDAISMGKSIAGGLAMGAFWIRQPYADLLSAGTHGTTMGGSPLVCAAALKTLEIIHRDKLDHNARELGNFFNTDLLYLRDRFPQIIRDVRGLGLMIGIELEENIPSFSGSDKTAAAQFVNRLHEAGILAVPAGKQVIRLLPPLNLTAAEANEATRTIELVVARTAS
jgi:acetylornithine aminotransferase/acetylornithine/N-succinyldiaminopimelate aminotransferase